MNETWIPAKGFEAYLEVSNLGRVKRKKRIYGTLVETVESKIIEPVSNGPYKSVQVSTEDKRKRSLMVNRLVAETFIPFEGSEYLRARHKNGDKSDNRAENLYWAIPKPRQ